MDHDHLIAWKCMKLTPYMNYWKDSSIWRHALIESLKIITKLPDEDHMI